MLWEGGTTFFSAKELMFVPECTINSVKFSGFILVLPLNTEYIAYQYNNHESEQWYP